MHVFCEVNQIGNPAPTPICLIIEVPLRYNYDRLLPFQHSDYFLVVVIFHQNEMQFVLLGSA